MIGGHPIWDFLDRFKEFRIPFRYLNYGKFPAIELSCAVDDKTFDLYAIIDTGAQYSVFNGFYISEKLLGGEKKRMVSNIPGTVLETYVHTATLSFPGYHHIPSFEMGIRFSQDEIPRNLLGRDFLDRFYLVFIEHCEEFYLIHANY